MTGLKVILGWARRAAPVPLPGTMLTVGRFAPGPTEALCGLAMEDDDGTAEDDGRRDDEPAFVAALTRDAGGAAPVRDAVSVGASAVKGTWDDEVEGSPLPTPGLPGLIGGASLPPEPEADDIEGSS